MITLREDAQQPLYGWVFKRNADGSIGIFAPPPRPGESQRTSDCIGPGQRDLHELLGKLADHMAALAEPVQEPDSPERRCGGPGCDMRCCQPVEEPVAWLRVIDEAMVTHHLGVADPTDDYETAKRKMNTLLSAAQDIGTYFAKQAEPETCTWQQDGDSDSGVYGTSCGSYFNIEDGTPEDNKMRWCCYCGKKLAQSLITEDGNE